MPTFTINAVNSLIKTICPSPGCVIFVSGPGNFIGADPVLGPLGFNGGLTRTHALLPGSPAINTGSNPLGIVNDQRGTGFPRVSGGAADMGAYESSSDRGHPRSSGAHFTGDDLDIQMSANAREQSPLPTGTVTFLFTDIEGSTALWEQYPDAMQIALARHDALLRRAIDRSLGHIVKTTGDGVFAVFGSAADALAACLVAQRALQDPAATLSNPVPAASDVPPPIALRVRMGLHTGVAEFRDADYFGAALNRAARIMSAAHGEQVLLSAATAELLRAQLPAKRRAARDGRASAEGPAQPRASAPGCRARLAVRLPAVGFPHRPQPPRRARCLRRPCRAHWRAGATPGRRGTASSPFWASGAPARRRLVTRFAWNSLMNFPGGIWFCDLSLARSLDGIVHAVAQGLDVPLGRDDPVTQIGNAIAGRGSAW